MIKRLLICLSLCLLATGYLLPQGKSAPAGALPLVQPETVGMSGERLGRIDAMFQKYVADNWINGASAIILKNGKIVYYKSSGYDDVQKKTPLQKDVLFRIASQTKAVTSVAVMMLYEQGKFLLDDPVSKYLPEFKNQKVLDKFNNADSSYTTIEPKRPVSIRDLLTHTSGLGYPAIGTKEMNALYAKYNIIMGITDKKIYLKDEMEKLAKVPIGFQPGEKWCYGLSVDVLGSLVEAVSGMSLEAFFKSNIFEPLGMNNTFFYLPVDKHDQLAKLYSRDNDNNLIMLTKSKDFDPDYPKVNGTYFSGGGGLVSTAYDYALFLQMLLNGGKLNGKRLLSESTIRMMRTNQIGELRSGSLFLPSGGDEFGLGFEIISKQGSIQIPMPAGSYGWGGTFGSLYWIDPVNKIAAQLVLQVSPNSYNEIRSKFVSLVYQAVTDTNGK